MPLPPAARASGCATGPFRARLEPGASSTAERRHGAFCPTPRPRHAILLLLLVTGGIYDVLWILRLLGAGAIGMGIFFYGTWWSPSVPPCQRDDGARVAHKDLYSEVVRWRAQWLWGAVGFAGALGVMFFTSFSFFAALNQAEREWAWTRRSP